MRPSCQVFGDNEPYDRPLVGDTIDTAASVLGLARAKTPLIPNL